MNLKVSKIKKSLKWFRKTEIGIVSKFFL